MRPLKLKALELIEQYGENAKHHVKACTLLEESVLSNLYRYKPIPEVKKEKKKTI